MRIAPGVRHEVTIALQQPAAAPTPAGLPVGGWLAVSSPIVLDVVEQGEIVGTSAAAKIMLPAGRHQIILRNQQLGFETERRVDVVAGDTTGIKVMPPPATMSANAQPWAEVFVDGASVGETPLANVAVPVGIHQITFRHPQFGERNLTLAVTAHGPNRATVDLRR